MKAISRTFIMPLAAGILLAISVSNAVAGCGDTSSLKGPFQFALTSADSRQEQPAAQAATAKFQGRPTPSIIGFWKFQFISRGNTTHNPSIPDGALLDFGYMQWHSDGTELINSAVHSDFCMGVWAKTGFLTFEINHFAINYDPSTGMIASYVNVREQDTLSPSGDRYTGTLTIDVYDPMGNRVDHLAGTVAATRLTVDSSIPDAIPSN
ncbi:MAG TPA: hypothetical protein VN519_10685 [Bryobacteraceae bacterium]|nr:hypothetical protein [Bryobacteraceae bacterium]